MGNSFGITPTLDKQHMNGVVRTKVDDCQVSLSFWSALLFGDLKWLSLFFLP